MALSSSSLGPADKKPRRDRGATESDRARDTLGTMKFGQRLRNEAIERWRPFYVDYKLLKKTLKNQQDAESLSVLFQSVLNKEIKTVSSFFGESARELRSTTPSLPPPSFLALTPRR